MPTPIIKENLTMLAKDISIVYKDTPFYLTWSFAVAVLLLIAVISISLYAWFRISLRNRTNVIIHMPDRTRLVKSYKNYTGDSFTINTTEKDSDGNPIPHVYFFRAECLETGYFGRYIEYDYKISEPRKAIQSGLKLDYTFISALLNTDLAVDLLLSQKFKDFVKAMLVIILVAVIINIIVSATPIFYKPDSIQKCSLAFTNDTIQTWKILQGIK